MWSAQKEQNWAAEVSRVSLFWVKRERERAGERVRLPVRDLAMNDANQRSRSRPFLIERSPVVGPREGVEGMTSKGFSHPARGLDRVASERGFFSLSLGDRRRRVSLRLV